MKVREIDPSFTSTERLWRRIERGHVRREGSKLVCKPSAFRLQVSVVREKHGQRETVCEGKFNGIAETTVDCVAAWTHGAATVAFVDEPTKEQAGHALVAVVAAPDAAVAPECEESFREAMRHRFGVATEPR